ncbi:uncharacterized protein PHACADRAFT_246528 [Phanerochaete carnosa HHB-10118-sp]|uniref:Uncharacterized protein n=1 Tax=Phanerochaete carnosa (strain HHB-10118-sp) TaxID=650164 RepID=K5XC11_PHACS|nr:uncharacterized protein PHACADRAFT_246528 [Phanerochaete carnosa HHB-10118-sp]EKM60527.1 hypothetical protein PHACADRAFT_246528 [Phanerochaete carnosa HHB-10118-sp]
MEAYLCTLLPEYAPNAPRPEFKVGRGGAQDAAPAPSAERLLKEAARGPARVFSARSREEGGPATQASAAKHVH